MTDTNYRKTLLLSTALASLLLAGANEARATVVNGGGSSLAAPTYTQEFTDCADCAPGTFSYYTVGSGAAQSAFLNNQSTAFGTANVFTVDFGASDASLNATQISNYKNSALGSASGPLIQIPTFGTPITLAVHIDGVTTNGDVNLTDAQICQIYNGTATWDLISPQPTVNGVGVTGTIYATYRADGSGTSFLFSQHLARVCPSGTYTHFNFPASVTSDAQATSLANTNFAAIYVGAVPGTLHSASLSGGVQSAITSNPQAVGYLSPDYTRIANVNLTAVAPTTPFVASVGNNNVLPTVQNTKNSLALAAVPVSTVFNDPMAWVPQVPNPTPSSTNYPIVGYTTWDLSQCYADANVAAKIKTFLERHLNNDGNDGTLIDDVNNNGFTQIPGARDNDVPVLASFADKLAKVFLTNTSGQHLGIQDATACSATGVTGR